MPVETSPRTRIRLMRRAIALIVVILLLVVLRIWHPYLRVAARPLPPLPTTQPILIWPAGLPDPMRAASMVEPFSVPAGSNLSRALDALLKRHKNNWQSYTAEAPTPNEIYIGLDIPAPGYRSLDSVDVALGGEAGSRCVALIGDDPRGRLTVWKSSISDQEYMQIRLAVDREVSEAAVYRWLEPKTKSN